MAYLEPISIRTLDFHDNRHPVQPFNIRSGYKKWQEVQDSLLDEKRVQLGGLEPGCETLRSKVAHELYEIYLEAGGTLTFERWRFEEEAKRVCSDPRTEEAFYFLGFARREGDPIGGVGLYNVRILGPVSRDDPTLMFEAMCSPMTEWLVHTSRFMRRLLEMDLTGVSDEGDALKFRLMTWNFPILEDRNRWDLDYPPMLDLMSDFGTDHDLVTDTLDGRRFIRSFGRVI